MGLRFRRETRTGVRDLGALPRETVLESLGSREERTGPRPSPEASSPGGLREARIGENRQLEKEGLYVVFCGGWRSLRTPLQIKN